MTSHSTIVKAIEAVQNMAQWMLDNGADEKAVEESLNTIEAVLRNQVLEEEQKNEYDPHPMYRS